MIVIFSLWPFLVSGNDVEQKVVLVTGCSSGIGFHTSTYLADKGYKVYAGLLDRKIGYDRLKNKTIYPSCLIPLQLDISSSRDIQNAVSYILDREGRIDALVNNAAYGLFGPVDSCTMEEIRKQFQVNLFGTIELTHAVLPFFRKQASGRIICVSSVRAFVSSAVQGVYSATKAALERIGESWASTLFPWNIHITLVEPGAVATSFPDHMVLGSFYQGRECPYSHVIENSLTYVRQSNEKTKAQHPKEIARVIERLLKEEKPPLRVQTHATSREEVRRFSKDITGSIWLEEEIDRVKKWRENKPIDIP